MKRFDGYEKAEAFTGDFEKLKLGGQICKILQVKADDAEPGANYDTLLRIGFDIAEGENKDFYKRQFDRKKATKPDAKWPGMYYQTIKADDLRYFKGFITAIENSNSGYKWDWDEQKLKGKLFGGVFGQEEYEGNDGKVHVSTKCRWVRSVEQVRKGIEAPEIKRLAGGNSSTGTGTSGFYPVDDSSDDDLPF